MQTPTDVFLHVLPATLAVGSFWCHSKNRLLSLNLFLCAAMAALFFLQHAWSGGIVMLLAVVSSAYALFTQRSLSPYATVVMLVLTAPLILWLNIQRQSLGWLEILPIATFMLYRYGELSCQERGLRLCILFGALLFVLYAWQTQTWGALVTEILFACSNLYYLLKAKH